MKVIREDKDGVAVLRLDGKLTGGADAEPIYESVREAVAEGRPNVLIDLDGIPWIDSPGLGVLMSIHALLRQESGCMKLLNPSARIRSILSVTKLDTVFETFDDEDAAVHSFTP